MTSSADIASTENTNSYAARVGWAVLICATLYVCYFSHLGAIGFVGPDEPRYAWIARDMAETGDWVTPRRTRATPSSVSVYMLRHEASILRADVRAHQC